MSDAAPAPAAEVPSAQPSMLKPASGPHEEQETKILEGLRKVYDPEIPMNIVDLGLVYGIDWADDKVTLHMTLTAPGCPVAGILAEEVKTTIEKVGGVKEATVDMVWEPPWTPERMSELAKRQFGYL